LTSERVTGPGVRRRPSETYVYTRVISVLSVMSASHRYGAENEARPCRRDPL
jgi:hypothetical protein